MLLARINEELNFERGSGPTRLFRTRHPARSSLAALLEALGQELLGAVGPLLFLLLNLAEEAGEILIAASIAGVLLVEVCPLERMIQNADQIVRGVFGASVVRHG